MRFAQALVLALVLASGPPAGTGSRAAQKPKPPKPGEGEWVRVPAYGTINATATAVSRGTVPDPPRSSVEFSGEAEATGIFTLQGADANGKQGASFTLRGSGRSGMHGGASIDCNASASGQGPADLVVMVNWKLQKYRFRIRFPSVRGQMRCVTTAPRMPPQEDVSYYSPSIPIPSWRDGELQWVRVDPAAAGLLARVGPQSHALYDLEGWIEGSLRGRSMRDQFVTDVYESRGGSAPGFAFMGLAESLAGQDVPAHVTVSWGLSLDPRRTEGYLTAFLPGPDEYKKWIPKAGKNEDEPGSVVSFVVAERKPGTVDTPPDRPRKFKVRFELVDVSSEPGICLNFPAKSAAKKTPDLRFPQNENANYYEISNEGKTAVSRRARERHQVFVASYDYGAYGKLQAKLLFDEGEVPASVVHLPDLPYVSVPYDENGNHIADQWEIDNGVFKDNHPADWDGDPDPSGRATDGDGLSLYEEYRGVRLKGSYTRLHPKQKDVFIVDKDGLCAASFFEDASGLRVNYLDWEEINPIDQAEEAGTVNFNHATSHVHPKYTIRVLEDREQSSAHEWGTSSGFHENVASDAKIYAKQIGFDFGDLVKRRGPEINFQRGRLGLPPLTPADLTAVVKALRQVVTVHEIGHLVGVDHHHSLPLPEDKGREFGNLACVMRYPFDGLGSDEASLFAYLVRPLIPDRFCDTAPDKCLKQINVKWFVK